MCRLLTEMLTVDFQVEAKSVEHIKVVNKGLENKIIELQQRLDERVSTGLS